MGEHVADGRKHVIGIEGADVYVFDYLFSNRKIPPVEVEDTYYRQLTAPADEQNSAQPSLH